MSNMDRLPPVSSLMSPPEAKPFETFYSTSPFVDSHPPPSSSFNNESTKLPPISDDRKRSQSETDLPSPPVTPYTGNKKRKSDDLDHHHIDKDDIVTPPATKDPVLFPPRDPTADAMTDGPPLFAPMLPPSTDSLVDQHINSHMAGFKDKLNKPTRDEYLLALSCVPIVSAQYNRSPSSWARKERETLERQMFMMNRYPSTAVVDARKKKKTVNTSTKRRPAQNQQRVQRTPRIKHHTPRPIAPVQKDVDSFETPASGNSRAPPRPFGTYRDDTDYNSINDYSPPIESLGGNAKALKADWKGQMIDLSSDPDRHLLSSAELNLASTLRLSCATYLCSKRRIFEARVKALHVGKEFRKTDAQQACKIDVNKASKLWAAYDRVGWFNPEYFRQYRK